LNPARLPIPPLRQLGSDQGSSIKFLRLSTIIREEPDEIEKSRRWRRTHPNQAWLACAHWEVRQVHHRTMYDFGSREKTALARYSFFLETGLVPKPGYRLFGRADNVGPHADRTHHRKGPG
jgi:hypothetical protein